MFIKIKLAHFWVQLNSSQGRSDIDTFVFYKFVEGFLDRLYFILPGVAIFLILTKMRGRD